MARDFDREWLIHSANLSVIGSAADNNTTEGSSMKRYCILALASGLSLTGGPALADDLAAPTA
ncbi:hypothetical protein ACI4AF_29570, partial [Klebsiella pneumoniae]